MKYLLSYLSAITFVLLVSSCTSTEHSENFAETTLPSQSVSLSDLSAFEVNADNWSVVGSVYANRKKEQMIQADPGTGILLNTPKEGNQANLFTSFEHADLDLELDFMMPRSSNSGIYLQSRYEVQLFDSWGRDSVSFADCGGIYQRWQNERGFEGHAPLTNASYAPGLWQHLSIKFEAPRFDQSGKKVRDALFREVKLNGVVIQENVQVSGPTRAASFEDEKPVAPLMLQGDHGPVAFRNIRYKRYGEERIILENISYKLYEGQFQSSDTLSSLKPLRQGNTDTISYLIAQQPQEFALEFTGNLTVPTSGDYLMTLRTAGASWLWIDEKLVVDHTQGGRIDQPGYGKVNLETGQHPFRLIYSKPGQAWRQGLAWEYEGPEITLNALQAPGSIPLRNPPPPHVVNVNSTPALQRGFWWVDEDNKKTHTLAVGLPSEVNYVYDLQSGTLLAGWGGNFVDATEMWHSRGEDQSLTPLGGVVPLYDRPTFAPLTSLESVWPDSMNTEEGNFRYLGYQLGENDIPVFQYQILNGNLQDQISHDYTERSLTRKITTDLEQSSSSWFCLVAEGSAIEHLPDGSYSIDDHRYYVAIEGNTGAAIQRERSGKAQLLLPLTQNEISYSIIW